MAREQFNASELLGQLERELNAPLSKRVLDTFREAYHGHQGQFRATVSGRAPVPFIVHPLNTAKLAIRYFPTVQESLTDSLEVVVCVALAHDLLEDTRIDGGHLEAIAGPEVRRYVEALTKPAAVVAGKTVATRNQLFLDHIAAAGPTAVFVKICDSLHNLSHPKSTPASLLEKAARKARCDYLTLLDRFPLSDQLQDDYRAAIQVAEEHLTTHADQANPDGPTNLEDAISRCAHEASGKILELHDIRTILAHILGADRISIWQSSHESDHLVPVEGTRPGSARIDRGAARYIASPLPLSAQEARRFTAPDETNAAVFSVPVRIAQDAVHLVVVEFHDAPPGWISLEAIAVVTQFLAHRLTVLESDRRSALARQAAALGMQFDVEVAARIGVQPSELADLQQWLGRCNQARLTVLHLASQVAADLTRARPLSELVQVKSRLKAVDSILRKFLPPARRDWGDFRQLEDVAGVRVVCPTRQDVDAFERIILEWGSDLGVRPSCSIESPRRDYITQPTDDGYEALHLILDVETRGSGDEISVALCELQIRTFFQDACASLFHATLYHAPRREHKRHRKLMKQIGEAIRECESLAEQLIHDVGAAPATPDPQPHNGGD